MALSSECESEQGEDSRSFLPFFPTPLLHQATAAAALSPSLLLYPSPRTSDYYNKKQEFYLWVREIKKHEPENLPLPELREMFEDFREDYNLASLPHKK